MRKRNTKTNPREQGILSNVVPIRSQWIYYLHVTYIKDICILTLLQQGLCTQTENEKSNLVTIYCRGKTYKTQHTIYSTYQNIDWNTLKSSRWLQFNRNYAYRTQLLLTVTSTFNVSVSRSPRYCVLRGRPNVNVVIQTMQLTYAINLLHTQARLPCVYCTFPPIHANRLALIERWSLERLSSKCTFAISTHSQMRAYSIYKLV